jgi:hypothetical protein
VIVRGLAGELEQLNGRELQLFYKRRDACSEHRKPPESGVPKCAQNVQNVQELD